MWWHEERAQAAAFVPAVPVPAEHPLFILYTSGHHGAARRASSTRPAATWWAPYATARWVFDLRPDDLHWCTADVGWITGHTYVVYGILLERRRRR